MTPTLALSSVGWVSVVTGHAGVALSSSGEVSALLANTAVDTGAVAIALAGWK